jgi:hypothetical protein
MNPLLPLTSEDEEKPLPALYPSEELVQELAIFSETQFTFAADYAATVASVHAQHLQHTEPTFFAKDPSSSLYSPHESHAQPSEPWSGLLERSNLPLVFSNTDCLPEVPLPWPNSSQLFGHQTNPDDYVRFPSEQVSPATFQGANAQSAPLEFSFAPSYSQHNLPAPPLHTFHSGHGGSGSLHQAIPSYDDFPSHLPPTNLETFHANPFTYDSSQSSTSYSPSSNTSSFSSVFPESLKSGFTESGPNSLHATFSDCSSNDSAHSSPLINHAQEFQGGGDVNSFKLHDVQPADEERRRRNTAASARFRQRKKLKEVALSRSCNELQKQCDQLSKRVFALEAELAWTKGLLVDRDGVERAAQLARLASTAASAGIMPPALTSQARESGVPDGPALGRAYLPVRHLMVENIS